MSDKQQRKQDKALSKVVQHAVRISEKPFLKVTKVDGSLLLTIGLWT